MLLTYLIVGVATGGGYYAAGAGADSLVFNGKVGGIRHHNNGHNPWWYRC